MPQMLDQQNQRQGAPLCLLLDGAELQAGDCHTVELEQPACTLPIQSQVRRVKHRHQPGKLKGQQPARHHAPGQQNEPALRAAPDQLTQSFLVPFLCQALEIVQQKRVPAAVGGRKAEVRCSRAQPAHPARRCQRLRRGCLAETAGRAEQHHSSAAHGCPKPLLQLRFQNGLLHHGRPPPHILRMPRHPKILIFYQTALFL